MADFNHLSGQTSGQFIQVDNTTFVELHQAGAAKEDVRVIVTNEGSSKDSIQFKVDSDGDTGTAQIKTVECPELTPFLIFDGVLAPNQKLFAKSLTQIFTVEGKVKTF